MRPRCLPRPIPPTPSHAQESAASQVRAFSAPTAPAAPALPTDLAAELAKFDAVEPTLGNNQAKKAETAEGGETVEEYLAFLESDLPKAEHH